MDFFGILYDMKNGKKVPYSKTYFDTLFAAKLAEMQIKTLTGTLPLTFRTSETALRSWTIYGNNYEHNYSAEGTLPLTFSTHTAGNADDWVIEGNNNVGKNLLDIESATVSPHTTIGSVDNSTGSIEVTAESDYTYRSANITLTDILEVGKVYTITLIKNNVTSSEQKANCTIRRVDTNSIIASVGYENFEAAGAKTFNYTHTQERAASGVYFSLIAVGNTSTGGTVSVSNLMIRERAASATFEPYQVGVGQRTANLFDESDFSLIKATSTAYRYGTIIGILPQGTYTLTATKAESAQYVYLTKKNNGTYTYEEITNVPYTFTADGVSQYILRIADQNEYDSWAQFGYSKIMLVKGPTAPTTYIPYGYQIPLTISHQGQPDKTVDIYIGDSPLTEGETVSKTSTGVDLELFEGENTVDTTLYNKPETSITYTDYIGVGEYVNGQWQIPLTVSHYTDNIFDKDAKNTNKGYEDSMCIMWAGSIPYPYMTGNEDNNYFVSEKIPCSPNTTYYLTDGIFKNTDNGIYSVFLWNRYRMSDYQAFPTEKTFTTGDDTKFIQLCVLKAYADTVMITTQPTETYIPHVEVNNVNIPIDAPLTEGQSVTDTLTISTFTGENTIDTTMTNKPNMSITYKGG